MFCTGMDPLASRMKHPKLSVRLVLAHKNDRAKAPKRTCALTCPAPCTSKESDQPSPRKQLFQTPSQAKPSARRTMKAVLLAGLLVVLASVRQTAAAASCGGFAGKRCPGGQRCKYPPGSTAGTCTGASGGGTGSRAFARACVFRGSRACAVLWVLACYLLVNRIVKP